MRSSFGGHCKEYRLVGHRPQFGKVGINSAGCLPVFCSSHDDSLFRKIDTLEIDRTSKEQAFLLGLKAIAFSLRRTQYLLGIDSQVEIFRPFILSELHQNKHVTITIDDLHEQYIRFIATYDFFQECIFAHKASHFDFFSSMYRSIPYNCAMFASTFTTISHDLEGKKINQSNDAIGITSNIFTIDNYLHVIVSCPRGNSATFYLPFFDSSEKLMTMSLSPF